MQDENGGHNGTGADAPEPDAADALAAFFSDFFAILPSLRVQLGMWGPERQG